MGLCWAIFCCSCARRVARGGIDRGHFVLDGTVRTCSNSQLTQNKQDAIEEAIRSKGAQFLSDDKGQERIVAQFTPRGEKMYKSMLHLRPQYRKKRDDRIYEFECPVYQAQKYFFKFGRDVTILEPSSLAERFKEEYIKAAQNYGEFTFLALNKMWWDESHHLCMLLSIIQ